MSREELLAYRAEAEKEKRSEFLSILYDVPEGVVDDEVIFRIASEMAKVAARRLFPDSWHSSDA